MPYNTIRNLKIALGALCAIGAQPLAATVLDIPSDPGDGIVRWDEGPDTWVFHTTQAYVKAGNGTAGDYDVAVFFFELPELQPDEYIESAVFSFVITDKQNVGSFGYDLYGLGYRSTPTPLSSDSWTGVYGADPVATPLQDDLFGGADGLGSYSTDAGASTEMATYINGLYTAGAVAGDYLVLRIGSDLAIGTASSLGSRNYTIASGNATNPLTIPTLSLTTAVPEPSTYAAIAGLLAFGLVVARRRDK